MSPAWGALLGVAAMLIFDAVRDWWNDRRDRIVDTAYLDVQTALRATCDAVVVPPFRIVAPTLYDGVALGWVDGAA